MKYYSTKADNQGGQNEAGHVSRQHDIYGPPHPISNIPHIQFAIADDETVKVCILCIFTLGIITASNTDLLTIFLLYCIHVLKPNEALVIIMQ